MDKKIVGLLGAAAALTTLTAANAAVPAQSNQMTPPTSYRDLLNPVPNAATALKADDARLAAEAGSAKVELAQFYYHHHHHHHFVPRPFRHFFYHHHHHHHHFYRD